MISHFLLIDSKNMENYAKHSHPQVRGIGQSFMDSAQVELFQKIQAGDEQRLLLVILAYKTENVAKDLS